MFKVAGPLWAQATAGGNNVFARLLKTGKKVLRRALQKEIDGTAVREIPKPTWSLRAHTVKVEESTSGRLIGGLFPKHALKTQAAEFRRQAALRLVRDARKIPVFAFVGLSLGASLETQKKQGTDDVLCSGIRELFQQYGGKESSVVKSGQHFSLQTLQLGQLIGQGCNAAVFEARPADTPLDEDKTEEAEDTATGSISSAYTQPETESEETQTEASATLSDDFVQEDGSSPSEASASTIDENPPTTFHTDDHALSLSESDIDEDDISIISEDEEEESSPQLNLDGWVLYRLSSPRSPGVSASKEASDSDSDIFILAGDEEGLESLPDLKDSDVEFGWSFVKGLPPETEAAEGIKLDASDTTSCETTSASVSLGSSLSSVVADWPSSNSGVTTQDPEPAPNIQDVGGSRDYPLAVKMIFNYSVESCTDKIMSAMEKETVPVQSSLSDTSVLGCSSPEGKKRLPPHSNIVAMHSVFVDKTPDLPEGAEVYPFALPSRLNKDGGFGRNATMFLVMKKYTMTLNEYLSTHSVDTRTRCLLFAQLLEGVAHLSRHDIAHRDLKSNNVLVDLSRGTGLPFLAISDFGNCLADMNYGLKLPYLTMDTDRGGNAALMAPEIKCATPGPHSILDYSKADLWTAGALAYEIFGERNPFYSGFDSRSYAEQDLPKLHDDTPDVVVNLVERMLKRNPSERPSPAVAATAMQLYLWAPSEMHPFTKHLPVSSNALWRCKERCHWLEQLTMETVCQRVFAGKVSFLDLQVKSTFLSRISQQDVFAAVAHEG